MPQRAEQHCEAGLPDELDCKIYRAWREGLRGSVGKCDKAADRILDRAGGCLRAGLEVKDADVTDRAGGAAALCPLLPVAMALFTACWPACLVAAAAALRASITGARLGTFRWGGVAGSRHSAGS